MRKGGHVQKRGKGACTGLEGYGQVARRKGGRTGAEFQEPSGEVTEGKDGGSWSRCGKGEQEGKRESKILSVPSETTEGQQQIDLLCLVLKWEGVRGDAQVPQVLQAG